MTKVTTFLINTGLYPNVRSTPEDITSVDPRCIIGLDTKDGFVRMSMETWNRLGFYISVLHDAVLVGNPRRSKRRYRRGR
jgi:hypothetical protein